MGGVNSKRNPFNVVKVAFSPKAFEQIKKTIGSRPAESGGALHALDYEPGTLVSLDGSGEDASEIVGGLIYMIIAACVFYFYAMDEFNIIGAIFYSLYWIITVPVHLIFF